MNTIETIRAEIERRMKELEKDKTIHPANQAGRIKELGLILSFLDTLKEQPVELEKEINNWQGIEAFPEGCGITPLPKAMEIVDKTARHFYELGRQSKEQPVKTNIVEDLKHYLATTPKEQIEKEWESLKEWDKVGPSISEFLGWEQPVCEGLEEEIKSFLDKTGAPYHWCDDKEQMDWVGIIARHFAQWQKEQMMKESVETWMIEGSMFEPEYFKRKVIIIKEDK